MSKISKYYLDLTEQAQELGYDTVEEALNDGYEVHMGKLRQCGDYMDGGKTEIEQAHEAWLKEKEIVLGILRIDIDTIDKLNDTNDLAITRTWVKSLGSDIKKAIKLIEEGEM